MIKSQEKERQKPNIYRSILNNDTGWPTTSYYILLVVFFAWPSFTKKKKAKKEIKSSVVPQTKSGIWNVRFIRSRWPLLLWIIRFKYLIELSILEIIESLR